MPPLPIETPPGRPPLPEGTPPPTPPVAGNRSRSNTPIAVLMKNKVDKQGGGSGPASRSESPSLEELEEQYKLLQEKLVEGGTEDSDLIVLDSCDEDSMSAGKESDVIIEEDTNSSIEILEKGENSEKGGNSAGVIEIADDSTADEESDIKNLSLSIPRQMSRQGSTTSINTYGELGTGSPLNSQPGTPYTQSNISFTDMSLSFKGTLSISKEFGTPIVHREKAITALPDSTNFGKGIEDHIPFENLPDSTGTFDKMRTLIQKIRTNVKTSKRKPSKK